MLCVICLKNNASIKTFMCSYCGNVPVFQKDKNRIDESVAKKFVCLDYKKRIEIIRLTNHRLNMIVKMNLAVYNSDDFEKVVEEFSLKSVIREYVELAHLGLRLNMRMKKDLGWATKITYSQYTPPLREEL